MVRRKTKTLAFLVIGLVILLAGCSTMKSPVFNTTMIVDGTKADIKEMMLVYTAVWGNGQSEKLYRDKYGRYILTLEYGIKDVLKPTSLLFHLMVRRGFTYDTNNFYSLPKDAAMLWAEEVAMDVDKFELEFGRKNCTRSVCI